MSAPFVSTAPNKILTALVGGAGVLFVAQLILGTAFYFAACVLIALLVAIFTCRRIGLDTIGGVLIAAFAVRYLLFSQIIKTAYGQPGDSNLAAPETTIAVLLVGIVSMCLAALVVARMLGDRQLIIFRQAPENLSRVRDISFLIGFGVLVVTRSGDASNTQFGGLVGFAKQLTNLGYFAIMVETYRVLVLTDGRRTLSTYLLVMLAALSIIGIAFNSKTGIIQPYLAYLLASIIYRRTITPRQLVVTVVGVLVFVAFVYPIVHILRAYTERGGITAELGMVVGLLTDALASPRFFNDLWEMMKSTPDNSLYAQGLNYLGSRDDLLSRFLLIANTDTIVNAVNVDGPYGPDLIRAGLDTAMPYFVAPNKLQVSTGDIVTWYYGLRTWGEVGYPANGLLADCYAALGWLGVAVIPFIIQIAFLTFVQSAGRHATGNLIGAFFLLINFHPFCEANIQQFITNILRGTPQYMIAIVGMFLIVDFFKPRRARLARAESPGH